VPAPVGSPAVTHKLARRKNDWPQLGPAMQALPNNKWRNFVEFLVMEKPGYGAQVNAARRAGFGHARTTPLNMASIASRLMGDARIQAAIAEESRKLLRGGAVEAVKAVHNGIRNPNHKDHARFVAMVLDRVDPVETTHMVKVEHKEQIEITNIAEKLLHISLTFGLDPEKVLGMPTPAVIDAKPLQVEPAESVSDEKPT
jgi:hypothetical protein